MSAVAETLAASAPLSPTIPAGERDCRRRRFRAPIRIREATAATHRCARIYSGTRSGLNAAASAFLTGGSTVGGSLRAKVPPRGRSDRTSTPHRDIWGRSDHSCPEGLPSCATQSLSFRRIPERFNRAWACPVDLGAKTRLALPGTAITCYLLPVTCIRCERESGDMGANCDTLSPADAKQAILGYCLRIGALVAGVADLETIGRVAPARHRPRISCPRLVP